VLWGQALQTSERREGGQGGGPQGGGKGGKEGGGLGIARWMGEGWARAFRSSLRQRQKLQSRCRCPEARQGKKEDFRAVGCSRRKLRAVRILRSSRGIVDNGVSGPNEAPSPGRRNRGRTAPSRKGERRGRGDLKGEVGHAKRAGF